MRKLMPHQEEGLRFLAAHNYQGGLFGDPGTGKTLVGIRAALGRTLVLCRRDDFLTWEVELALEDVPSNDIVTIESGTDVHKSYGKWNFCTYDLVRNPAIQEWIRRGRFQTVIADELHAIKRWPTKRTKCVIKCTRAIPRRIGLTATPITNEVLDVFSECFFLDNGRLFGTSDWMFLTNHYLRSGPGWYLRRGAEDKVVKKLQRIGQSVNIDEVMTLPPIVRIKKSVPMTTRQRKVYERLITDWEYEYGGKEVELKHVITQISKLRQVASGFIYTPEKATIWISKHSNKLDLLEEMLTSIDHLGKKPKVVVWAMFRAELRAIRRMALRAKIKHVYYHGRPADKRLARTRFRDDKTIRLFIAQADSGVGMNELVAADTAIYFSNSRRVVSRQQSLGRIRRKGSEQHKRITYYDLLTENSIDLPVLESVNKSIDLANYILRQLRQGRSFSQSLTDTVSRGKTA